MNIKNNQTNASKKLGKLPIWSLKDLYLSQNDKSLSRDLNNIKNGTLKFEKKYLNKVKSLSAENLYTAIIHLEQIDVLMDKVLSYAHLLVAEDGNNDSEKEVTIAINDLDEKAPEITSEATVSSIDENSGAAQLVYTAKAGDSFNDEAKSDGVKFNLTGENIFIFGETVEGINNLKANGYNPHAYYEKDPELKAVLDWLSSDYFSPQEGNLLEDLPKSLLEWGDPFCVLADYRAYLDAQEKADQAFVVDPDQSLAELALNKGWPVIQFAD
mgnify:CR=1 FL=1